MLITIEGIDGSGKSTLIENLKNELKDINPVFTREPGATWIGEQVRRGIAEEIDPVAEALLFVADHAAHLDVVIRPGLSKNLTIISDRYTDSRYAYQSVTLKNHLIDPVGWLRLVHNEWTVRPDKTFLLVIDPEISIQRIKNEREGNEHFERLETLKGVQSAYLKLAAEEPDRFVIIDAEKDRDEIASFVAGEIRNLHNNGA
ncbi:dTMP kinase [Methanoplanus sp. FWC-SCC4]|uniref:Probable thymidylate kinase n=1 Tax=Methanochimaera problematica TaxID=2609417 RepID=A0AA97FAN5_9EURY|nr:dTMP kinase [Methanoplanus sp. FWC-SCC4]WOF15417.1 dTMP kinase [Methanoplanus sp. FWC-SCC4]